MHGCLDLTVFAQLGNPPDRVSLIVYLSLEFSRVPGFLFSDPRANHISIVLLIRTPGCRGD